MYALFYLPLQPDKMLTCIFVLGKEDHAHNWVFKTHSLLTTYSRVESTLGRNPVDKYGQVLFGKDTELFPTAVIQAVSCCLLKSSHI